LVVGREGADGLVKKVWGDGGEERDVEEKVVEEGSGGEGSGVTMVGGGRSGWGGGRGWWGGGQMEKSDKCDCGKNLGKGQTNWSPMCF